MSAQPRKLFFKHLLKKIFLEDWGLKLTALVITVAIWLGVTAPAQTPRPILDRLNGEITKVTTRADTAANWEKQGAEALVMSVSEFEKYLNQDIAKWAHVVKVSGAKPE